MESIVEIEGKEGTNVELYSSIFELKNIEDSVKSFN